MATLAVAIGCYLTVGAVVRGHNRIYKAFRESKARLDAIRRG